MIVLNDAKSQPGMSAISVLLNLLWILFGGLWMAAGWVIAAIIMALTIIGLPWTRAAFNIAVYTLLPFGQKAVSRAAYGHNDIGTGPLGILGVDVVPVSTETKIEKIGKDVYVTREEAEADIAVVCKPM